MLIPVFPTDFELANLRNQLRTAAQFFDIDTVKEYILTAPWDSVDKLQAFVDKEWAVDFPKYHTAARVVQGQIPLYFWFSPLSTPDIGLSEKSEETGFAAFEFLSCGPVLSSA